MEQNNLRKRLNLKIWFPIIIILVLLVGYVVFGEHIRFFIFHKGLPPGYCDPGPCIVSTLVANNQYGFNIKLPVSWKGYSILTETWQGAVPTDNGDKIIEQGPELLIRHPLWTEKNPRQDIPIMVFTLDQWNSLQQDKFHIGAAPINPSELGRNSRYVFALPARYNYAFPTGWEEVDQVLSNKENFKAFPPLPSP